MTIKEINSKIINSLSNKQLKSDDYETRLKTLLRFCKRTILQIDDNESINSLPANFDKNRLKKELNSSISALLKSYNCYLQGDVSSAIYITEKKFLDNEIGEPLIITPDQKWFRARIGDCGRQSLSPNEMFHIPFELRTKVENCRFSIKGCPCLYMGSTILTCWEEMRRPALDDFVVCRIEANENCDIKLLDIRIPDIYVDPSLIPIDEKTKLQNLSLLQKWPLIIACSMKATDTSSPFIYEYIHPQLLMLAIQKHSGNIRGVVYSSTKYDKKMGEGLNAYSNVAIPTKSSKSLGYCDYLSKCFKLTRGLPYIEAEIKNIFLQDVKDSEKSYCYRERTRFEQLESHLLSMELKSIQMSNELQS